MMTLEQVRNGLQKLFNAGPGVACSAFPLAHWINAIEEHIQGDEARDTAITDAFDEAHPIYTHPPAQAAQVGGIRLGAPAWPGQMEGSAPPEGWVSIGSTIAPPAQPTTLEDAVREVDMAMIDRARTRFAYIRGLNDECENTDMAWREALAAALQENAK